MHLTSLRSQAVRIGNIVISFKPGESILTEVSYKYSVPEFSELAFMAGCVVSGLWTDESKLFSVYYLRRNSAFGFRLPALEPSPAAEKLRAEMPLWR